MLNTECPWCEEGAPEWSPHARVWIHRRPRLDRKCLNPLPYELEELKRLLNYRQAGWGNNEIAKAIQKAGFRKVAETKQKESML